MVDQEAKTELSWLITKLEAWNGKALIHPDPHITIQSDASLSGWGAFCQSVKIGGLWLENEKHLHINQLELKAAYLALEAFSKTLSRKHTFATRQQNSCCIHQLNGGHIIKSSDIVSHSNMGLLF